MPESGSQDSDYRPINAEQLKAIAKRGAAGCRVHAAWILVPFLFLLCLQVGMVCWIRTSNIVCMTGEPKPQPYVTVVIDMNGTRLCSKSVDQFPCINKHVYMSSDEPIGPLRCWDDAYAQRRLPGDGTPDNCHGNRFLIAPDGKGVVIPETGLYRIYAKVTFFDKINHHTSISVRVDPPVQQDCRGNHLCIQAREDRAHAWVTCYAHQPPAAANGTRDFANCALDGVRRFSAGETVGLQVAIGYREISGHFKATYMYIHKL